MARMNLEIEIKVIPRMVSGIETSFRPERRTSGWLMDTLSCVKRIGRKTFTLSDMYAFEGELHKSTLTTGTYRLKFVKNCKFCGIMA